MATFVFKLHGVLRHREMIEQEKQRAFAVAQAEKAAAQAEIKRLDETVQQALADLRANHLTGSLNLSFLAAHRRFMLAMQRQGLVLMQKVQDAQKKVDAAQTELAEAAKQRKIMDKLRERQHERWQLEISRKELAQLDEVAMQMSFQNNLAAGAMAGDVVEPEALG
ncbi:MAG TPA: flagellar export protein FliJ [Tepidisphaeraceae bacterium]|nr:flagellar export protein FliJ [Tepidisphaeraceae bacterium]